MCFPGSSSSRDFDEKIFVLWSAYDDLKGGVCQDIGISALSGNYIVS